MATRIDLAKRLLQRAGAVLAARGVTTVALNERELTEYRPDGTSASV